MITAKTKTTTTKRSFFADLQPGSGSGRWEMGTIVNWIQNILQKKRFPNFYFAVCNAVGGPD